MRRVKKQPIVVTFLDHASDVGDSNELEPIACEVVGWLVGETKTHYRIATWVAENTATNHNNEGYAIVKSTVTSIRRLR